MRAVKSSVAIAALGIIGLAVWAGTNSEQTGEEMTKAAERLMNTLNDGQKAKASFAYDDPERLNWHFIPRERKGLTIKDMEPSQRALTFGLLRTGVGTDGFLKATTIMSLEQILRDMEQGRGPLRDPERYFLSIFGTPSNNGRWGWRIEGHHLSLNFTIDGGKIVSATPAFFGSNPGEVRQGPRKGLRTLGDLEDLSLRLLQSLDQEQKKTAVIAEKAPAEIHSADFKGTSGGLSAAIPEEAPQGIAYAKLNDHQKALLQGLIEDYAGEMPADIARGWLEEIKKAGVDRLYFAWQGEDDRTKPHAYKVQGPTFLIEFNNTQNGANHIHSIWRNRLNDFALPPGSKG